MVDAAAVNGQVVNGTTHQPIAGAKVVLTSYRASAQTQSNQDGGFRLPALRHWTIVPLLSEGWVSNGHLRIDAAGYKPYTGEEVGGGASAYGTGDGDLLRVQIMLAPAGSKGESTDGHPRDIQFRRVPQA